MLKSFKTVFSSWQELMWVFFASVDQTLPLRQWNSELRTLFLSAIKKKSIWIADIEVSCPVSAQKSILHSSWCPVVSSDGLLSPQNANQLTVFYISLIFTGIGTSRQASIVQAFNLLEKPNLFYEFLTLAQNCLICIYCQMPNILNYLFQN